MFGKKKRTIAKQQEQIRELEQKLGLLEEENRSFKGREDDLNRRETSIGRVIIEATAAADKTVADAQDRADGILKEAREERETAKHDADRLIDDAYRNARDIVKEAEQAGQQKLDETQAQIEQYAALLNSYDKLVQEQILMAKNNAKRFEELSRALHEAVPKLLAADGTSLLEEEKTEAETGAPETESEQRQEPEKTQHDVPADERVWTVDEIAKPDGSFEAAQVDSIIDEILSAAKEPNE